MPGVRVFANASAQRVTGDVSGSFNGYTPRVANWGVSLSRPRYTLRVNWNYTGRKRLGPGIVVAKKQSPAFLLKRSPAPERTDLH